ncbi:MAG TPA: DUF1223 domain-containing protein [Candidatus Acidoferrales bacterium]|nr:DUF1223 domain-containing protein [Candidatus Acidoferrales bacterium]
MLVELFTAEGCSSCPPAEKLLAALEARQPASNAEIIPLEEHVDYWNHDGWTDPFSSSDWTARQQDYVFKFKESSPYTPEMVVDGDAHFNGSMGHTAVMAIEAAARQPETEITVSSGQPGSHDAEAFSVKVAAIQGDPQGDTADVWLAITETGLHSNVTAGENAGQELYHVAVMRYLHKIGVVHSDSDPIAYSGTAEVKLKSNWKLENLSVVVFVQDKKSLRVLGVASAKVSS